MPSPKTIADLHIFDLEGEPGNTILLRGSDHLLRRFGLLELHRMEAGQTSVYAQRPEADIFCFVLEGVVSVALEDQREGSPSKGVNVDIRLEASQSQGLLIPFGVAHRYMAEKAVQLLLLSTHEEGEEA